jgi:hypothetical protein
MEELVAGGIVLSYLEKRSKKFRLYRGGSAMRNSVFAATPAWPTGFAWMTAGAKPEEMGVVSYLEGVFDRVSAVYPQETTYAYSCSDRKHDDRRTAPQPEAVGDLKMLTEDATPIVLNTFPGLSADGDRSRLAPSTNSSSGGWNSDESVIDPSAPYNYRNQPKKGEFTGETDGPPSDTEREWI